MKRVFWTGFGVLAIAAVFAAGYVLFTPKIGHATRAEIEAALPAELKVVDPPDPAGEARFGRLTDLVATLDNDPMSLPRPGRPPARSTAANEKILREVEALLAEGRLRVPKRTGQGRFGDLTAVKNAARLMARAAKDARERGDRAACGRWAALGLQYAQALEGAGGVVIDQLVAIAIDSIAVRAAYLAEVEGGLDAVGRKRLLALLQPRDGGSPEMAAAVRRDFAFGWMPVLLDPEKREKELMDSESLDVGMGEPRGKPPAAGTYDPVATARLGGAIYAATMADLLRPASKTTHEDARLAEEAGNGVPVLGEGSDPEPGPKNGWAWLKYRVLMNSGRNTLGRKQAASGVLTQMSSATAHEAASVDLLRAVVLLRMGLPASVPDPYGNGNLRIDPKRKIVWSAGKNGKDDGGSIGKGFDNAAPDLGCPYGDGAWAALHAPVAVPASRSPGR